MKLSVYEKSSISTMVCPIYQFPYFQNVLSMICSIYDFVIYELSFYNFIYLGKKSFSIYEITYLWKIFHFYDISFLNFLYKITPL